ncbi:MAG: hypothetical protein K0R17_1205 [Rariglobus sp.]|jgi:hypothetical protein|nr:hypothetical protein [Rariglobus sp.]
MKTSFILSALLVLTVWGAGCASPDARIKRSPEIFARLTPEQQALVKEGKVAIGFDADAVRLAVGAPDRTWTRTDAAGVSEVWSYTTWTNDRGYPLYRGWYHVGSGLYPYYLNEPARKEQEYFKVVFGPDGKVTAIEQDSR